MDKNEIVQRHLSGTSNRTIAKILGVNRKTVNKYVSEFVAQQKQLSSFETIAAEQIREATEKITETPTYPARASVHRKYSADMDTFLDEILAAEEEKRIRLRTSKQQLTKQQIHALMREAGFDIGLTTIQNKIREKQNRHREAFISQTYNYGQRFEYDFGEVHLFIGGSLTKVHMAVMSAPASGYRYARLYLNQKFDVFIDSQVCFFEHLGGCFSEGVYDNMRNVVSKFIGKNDKLLNPGLLKFAAYYGFRLNVTNCYSGNEKGHVENAVKVVRNQAFARHFEFDSLQDAQKYLEYALVEINKDSSIEEEKAYLSASVAPYEAACLYPGARVDKYSCVRVEKSSYSVPDALVGKCVLVKSYPNDLVIMHKQQVVARHHKSDEENKMCLDINHYLDTFCRKPGALANSTALKALPRLKAIFDDHYRDRPKEFIELMQTNKDATVEEMAAILSASATDKPNTHTRALHDAIAAQTLLQISLIEATGREVLHAS